MTVDSLDGFFEGVGIELEIELYEPGDDLTDLIDEAKDEIKNLSKDMFLKLYKKCINITLVERNIFILWHLFGFARNLIRSFILFESQSKHYDTLLSEWNQMISIVEYFKAYDIFEVKANYFMDLLKKLDIFNLNSVEFEYEGYSCVRDQMLKTLQEAESEENIIYPAIFSPIEEFEHIMINLPLFYLQNKVRVKNSLNINECVFIKKNLVLDPYSTLPTTSFYLFYYNIANKKILKTKLEEFVINPYFAYIIEEENKNNREYLNVDIVDLENTEEGNVIPPQRHTLLLKMIQDYVQKLRNC
uniref:Uncharacterized protein n=1 Tax=Meloidogyne enterolobii TaxID=390850 RepID=A0A6V7WI03_MELEN|nr:unnamed protein product [Meloidogyne enterolobii]